MAKTMIRTLDQLKPGEHAVIHKFERRDADETYLMEMGLIAGTPVKLIKYAPMGDPMELRIRGYHLSIRRAEAKHILVEGNGHNKT